MKPEILAANRRLATLLGWKNIVDAGGALMGTPTWVCDNSRGQVMVPNWAGDWMHCGPLLGDHRIDVIQCTTSVDADWACGSSVVECGSDRDEAIRIAIVEAACDQLEAEQ